MWERTSLGVSNLAVVVPGGHVQSIGLYDLLSAYGLHGSRCASTVTSYDVHDQQDRHGALTLHRTSEDLRGRTSASAKQHFRSSDVPDAKESVRTKVNFLVTAFQSFATQAILNSQHLGNAFKYILNHDRRIVSSPECFQQEHHQLWRLAVGLGFSLVSGGGRERRGFLGCLVWGFQA